LNTNIFLIGFMGSGKTHWGRRWASKNKLNFFDLDTEIEKAFKMTVQDIFEKKGEEKFRELERYNLRKFEAKKNFLLSCGGGTPCFFDNIEWMLKHGKVIYLRARAQVILEQVMHETEQRPLLKKVNPSELLFFIEKKLQEREPFYSRADFTFNVEELNDDSLSDLITPPIKKIRKKTAEILKPNVTGINKRDKTGVELHHDLPGEKSRRKKEF